MILRLFSAMLFVFRAKGKKVMSGYVLQHFMLNNFAVI